MEAGALGRTVPMDVVWNEGVWEHPRPLLAGGASLSLPGPTARIAG